MSDRIYGPFAIRVLVIAMTFVALAVASTLIYFEASTVLVRHETDLMLANAVPSIGRLTDARATLRGLDGVMDGALLEMIEKQPIDLEVVRSARRHLAEDISAYRLFPYYEAEPELNHRLDIELRRLDEVQARLEAFLRDGKLQAAHELENGEWRRASDGVDERLRALSAFNLNHVTGHALRIDGIRRSTSVIAMIVGCGALVLAFAATLVAGRAVRRQTHLQRERAQELEMFSARVAHDLMSPLAATSLVLEIVEERLVDDPTIGRMVTRAVGSLKRVRLVVNDLLDFARAGGRPARDARASADKVLQDVIDDLRPEAERARVELRIDGAAPVDVACAPGILTVLVSNLATNAIKHMGDSSRRVVTLRSETCKGGDAVRFEVEDTGPGIAPGFEQLAFEPYVRGNTETTGLGLGLATVQRLVSAHEGRVGVRRADGTGAIFWFDLPRAILAPSNIAARRRETNFRKSDVDDIGDR